MRHSKWPAVTTWAVILFFYLPIAVLIVNSFNAARFGGEWKGFSLKWYTLLFQDGELWVAVKNTLLLGLAATLTSMVVGTAAAFALNRFAGSRLQRAHYTLVYMPLVVPEILTGLSLLLFFVALKIEMGFTTLYLAHVTFCVSYVAMTVLARLQDFDYSIVEASQDLGAGAWTTLWKVLVPVLAPGILAGGLLAFTLSIDDFVISFFVAGPGTMTLPIKIYSMIKHGAPALINALSAILLSITFLCVGISQYVALRKSPK